MFEEIDFTELYTFLKMRKIAKKMQPGWKMTLNQKCLIILFRNHSQTHKIMDKKKKGFVHHYQIDHAC